MQEYGFDKFQTKLLQMHVLDIKDKDEMMRKTSQSGNGN